MEYDAVNAYDLVFCEIRQQLESGHDLGEAEAELAESDPTDRLGLLALYDRVAASPMRPGWAYDEPSEALPVLATLPPARPPAPVDEDDYDRKVHGGWLGRVAGCNLGKPVEDGEHWTSARLREYLGRARAYPLRDYVPALDPMPDGFTLHWTWPETTLGRIRGSARDDDLDYTVLGLLLAEKHGPVLQTDDIARAWLEYLPFRQVFTAERVAYRNLVDGLPVEHTATFRNPYREWIGAQIRGDIFGYLHPGDPRAAATSAHVDARLSHTANGIYGEMWAAALVASAFTSDSAAAAVACSIEHIPPLSRLAEAIRFVLERYTAAATWEASIMAIEAQFGHYSWVHTIPNAAAVAAGLLWGHHDFAATVGLTVQAAMDTDSNGATAGSVIGVLLGADAIPEQFMAPLGDRLRCGLFGLGELSIADLARRTVRLRRSGWTYGRSAR